MKHDAADGLFTKSSFLHFNLEKVWADMQVVFRHAPGREEKERVKGKPV
jgi:hypothetical protein